MLIYYVEDDLSISNIIQKVFENMKVDYIGFNNSNDFFKSYDSVKPDIILLDIMLPNTSGLDILKNIRTNNKKTPILMLSALSSEIDQVIALDYGADDYITKPFGVLELKSRINSFIRKINKSSTSISFNCLTIKTNKQVAYCNKEELNLTNKEYELLYLLLKNNNNVVDKDYLLKTLWNEDKDIEPRIIDVHINNLRKKLKNNKADVEIKSVIKQGYKLKNITSIN